MAVSAVEAAVQASRINQAAMLGLSQTIESNFQKVSQAQKLEADVFRNIAESAINFRQNEIDNFFKQETLKLREKELKISGLAQAADISAKGRYYDILEDRARIDLEKAVNADRSKPLISALSTQLKATEDEFKQIDIQIKRKTDQLNKPTLDQVLDGTQDKISSEIRALEEEMIKVSKKRDDIGYEMTNIANGGEYTGQFYKIPNLQIPASNNNTRPSLPSRNQDSSALKYSDKIEGLFSEGELDSINLLLPTPDGRFPEPSSESLSEANESRRELGIEDQDTDIGQIPDVDFRSPPPEPKKYTKEQLLRVVMDERFKPDQVAPFIQAGDEEAKKFFQDARDIELREYLGFYASGKGYDPSGKLDDPSNFQELTINQFQRYGGDLGTLRSLTVEARIALSNSRMEAYKELRESGDASSDAIEALTSIKYNNWIETRLAPVDKPQAGGARGVSSDGKIPSGARPEIADKIINPKKMDVNEINDEFWSNTSASRAKRSDANKKFSSIIGLVRDKFSIRDGTNPSSLNNKFLDFVRDNSDFKNIILPMSSFTPISMDPYGAYAPELDVKSYNKELKNKLKSMEFKDAVLAFEEYFKIYPEKLSKLLEK